MSPEQAQGEDVDSRTDLWSLGVVLYEMLTGELPFRGDRDLSVIHSIIHEEPKPLKQLKPPVPEELQQVIARALRKDPGARYGSAEDVLRDLRKYEEALQAEAAGVLNLRSFVKRLRRPAVAVPTALAIVAIATAAFFFFKHQGKVRWAREVALPEIERMIEGNDIMAESRAPLSAGGPGRGRPWERPEAGGAFREVLPEHQCQDRSSRRQRLHEGIHDPRGRVVLSGDDTDRKDPRARRHLPLEVRKGRLRDGPGSLFDVERGFARP